MFCVRYWAPCGVEPATIRVGSTCYTTIYTCETAFGGLLPTDQQRGFTFWLGAEALNEEDF